MVRTNKEYLSNDLTYVYQTEIGQRKQYTANTGVVTDSTANSNLDGTGTLATIVRANSSNGTLVKTLTLKAQNFTTRGMIRLYVDDGTNTDLIAEIEIPAVERSGTQATFSISLEIDYMLTNLYYLKASTQNGERMEITAEGLDLSFP